MTREEMLYMIPPGVFRLLNMMFFRFRVWRPRVGYPSVSAGFASGGAVGIDSIEDMEEEADTYAVGVTEAAYDELNTAERIAIRVAMGQEAAVWAWRDGVLESAIEKLESRLRRNGVC